MGTTVAGKRKGWEESRITADWSLHPASQTPASTKFCAKFDTGVKLEKVAVSADDKRVHPDARRIGPGPVDYR
jgi:hypothetical protein